MNIQNFDLNLLRVFHELMRERSVSAAARRLGVSQPTVSAALAKLRLHFDDDLFIKGARGVDPTLRALSLQSPVEQVLETIRSGIISQSPFEPAISERRFTLLCGEMGQMIFIHHLLARIRKDAPGIAISVVAAQENERVRLLEDGRVDLAIGHYPQFVQSNFFQQLLWAKPLVCVSSAQHPAIKDGIISLENFLQAEHAVLGIDSNLNSLLDNELRRRGIARNVVIELANVAAVPLLLPDSQLLTVLPESLARIFSKYASLQIAPLPLELPNYEVKQFWHRRVNRDPAVTWLRSLVKQELQH